MNVLKPLMAAFLLPATFAPSDAKNLNKATILPQAREILMQDTLKWDAPLPFDQDVVVGELKNGFKYYIRKNNEPEKRVTMYLGMKAGSILETYEEVGPAHFM